MQYFLSGSSIHHGRHGNQNVMKSKKLICHSVLICAALFGHLFLSPHRGREGRIFRSQNLDTASFEKLQRRRSWGIMVSMGTPHNAAPNSPSQLEFHAGYLVAMTTKRIFAFKDEICHNFSISLPVRNNVCHLDLCSLSTDGILW